MRASRGRHPGLRRGTKLLKFQWSRVQLADWGGTMVLDLAMLEAMTKATMMRGVLVPAACPRLPSRKTSSSGYMVPGANLGLEHAQTANHMVRGSLRRLLLTAHRLPTHGRRLLAILQRMDSRLNRRRA